VPDSGRTTTVKMRRLAAELRGLRASAGLSREDVVERTGVNVATLYRIEHGRVRPQARTLQALLEAYGVNTDQASELLALSRESGQRGWLQGYTADLPDPYLTYISFENEARSIRNYESLLLPGLLQTRHYARAVIAVGLPGASRDEVERRVEVTMARQAVLTRAEPVGLWAIVDEAALHRQVGGKAVMQNQLQYLTSAIANPAVTLQVISFEAGAHPGMPGSFTIVRFPADQDPDLVYLGGTARDQLVEAEPEVARYNRAFQNLRAMALSPADSRALIAGLARASLSS
jgi:transcriptional regulator with XRE-family HTH domain